MEDAPPPADSDPDAAGSDPDTGIGVFSNEEDRRLLRVLTGLLPNLFHRYERLCKWLASDGVHNLGFFASTLFCGPAGLYLWESVPHETRERQTGGFFRRLFLGVLAWFVLALGLIVLLQGGIWLGLVTLLPGRAFRWIVRKLKIARARPAPGVPGKLTFEFDTLDVVSLVFVAFIFLAMVANRDDLMNVEMESDPDYHKAVARQILEQRGIPEWDRWEYAPFGRPHLYQPALHLLIAFFSGEPEAVPFGFNTMQILLFPAALLSGWYFARWLFGAAVGFAALVFLSMETWFLASQAMVMPAALATALVPLVLMTFLTRRTVATVLLVALALYTHGGVPPLLVLGLLVISVRHREYFPFFRKVTAFAGLLYLPWLVRWLEYLPWLGTSSGAMGPAKNAVESVLRGLLQLQVINPVLLVLALWAWRRRKDERLGYLKCILIGFLPMLFSYGGRYFMHTWPLWAVFIAQNFRGWIERRRPAEEAGDASLAGLGTPASSIEPRAQSSRRQARARKSFRRRVLAMILLAFVPLPVIALGMPGSGGVKVFPSPTGANLAAWVAAAHVEPDRDFETMAEFMRLTMPAERISGKPPPPDGGEKGREEIRYTKYLASEKYARLKRRIVHVGREPYGNPYLANRITVATGLRTDSGGWAPEVRSPLMLDEVERAREKDPECLFVFRKKRDDFTREEIERLKAQHRLDWTRRFGARYLVGGRGLAQAVGVPGTPRGDDGDVF